MGQNVKTWSGVGVDVQTALAAPKTITGISKASVAVCNSTAHGYANNDYVLLRVSGMRQVNLMVARVANVTADNFQLTQVDSTLFDTFVSGTAEKITFGASAATFTDINVSGGEANKTPSTTIHVDQETNIVTTKTPVTMAITSQWIPSDPALAELKKADTMGTSRAIRIRFKDQDEVFAYGSVSAPLVPTGSAQQIVTTPVSIELQGPLGAYASA